MRDTIFQLCFYIIVAMIVFSLIFSILVGISVADGRHVFSSESVEYDENIEIDTASKEDAFSGITGKDLEES